MKPVIVLVFLVLFSVGACKNELARKKESKTNIESILKLDDPIFYVGSSFGNYFQAFFKQGLFNEMVELTDSKSRFTLGDTVIMEFYRDIDFAFVMKLKSKTDIGNIKWLNYEVNIQATKKMFRFPVVIEKKSCKVDFIQFKASLENIQ